MLNVGCLLPFHFNKICFYFGPCPEVCYLHYRQSSCHGHLTWTQVCRKMPLETGSALPLTLPAIPLFSKATRSQTPFQDSLLFVQLSCTIGKRCQPSKDLWEDLKPFIRQVYVEENKTLQQLAEFLRDEHDFFPT